jgi:hypothetical protein
MYICVKKILVLSTLLVLTIIPLFASGGQETQTAPASGASTQTAEGASAQSGSAADLVRELGGESKAQANGSTVMLTDGVRLENTLVVPAGVTLDLTRKSLTLGNNAVLTVNGTVNANDWGIITNSAAATPATINGSGTIQLMGEGGLIFVRRSKLILDGITLVGVKNNPDPLVVVAESGEIIMKSGVITGNTNIINGHGGGVNVSGGTFIMEGGAITGNNTKGGLGGAGVFVFTGVFTMKGGVISGNIGGGVGVGGSQNTGGGTFILEGGTIYGSSAQGGNANTDESAYPNTGALRVNANSTAKWGTGGTYTRGGVSQTGGSNIASTNDTLIAIPAR